MKFLFTAKLAASLSRSLYLSPHFSLCLSFFAVEGLVRRIFRLTRATTKKKSLLPT